MKSLNSASGVGCRHLANSHLQSSMPKCALTRGMLFAFLFELTRLRSMWNGAGVPYARLDSHTLLMRYLHFAALVTWKLC